MPWWWLALFRGWEKGGNYGGYLMGHKEQDGFFDLIGWLIWFLDWSIDLFIHWLIGIINIPLSPSWKLYGKVGVSHKNIYDEKRHFTREKTWKPNCNNLKHDAKIPSTLHYSIFESFWEGNLEVTSQFYSPATSQLPYFRGGMFFLLKSSGSCKFSWHSQWVGWPTSMVPLL